MTTVQIKNAPPFSNEDGVVSGFCWLDNNGNMLFEYKPL